MTRRELLWLVSATALGCAARVPAIKDDTTLDAWLDAELGDADLAAVAAAWRARHPGCAPRDALLAGRPPGESLSAHFARRVAAEHAAGQVEILDGWYLCPTEARLAAVRARG
jgi:hypothetical protein